MKKNQGSEIRKQRERTSESLKNTTFFRKKLRDFFKKSGREHLPWRKKKITAYEVWVSEIMLQQTQVNRVIEYYVRFLKRFPNVKSLARISWEKFLPYYQGLGYYTRGRNMLRTAQVIVNEYHGKFPQKIEELEKLPGVGPYTARAIASFATGAPYLAWDTNVRRVLGRFFLGGKELLTLEAEEFFEGTYGKDAPWLNAALMDFGSQLCGARPKCEACMLHKACVYYREKGRGERKEKKHTTHNRQLTDKKINWRDAQVYVFLHEKHKQYYSSVKRHFQPFILPRGYTARHRIKKYFQEKYNLILSVRPPHEKEIIKGKPTLFVNAQILLGEPRFKVFSKATVRKQSGQKGE